MKGLNIRNFKKIHVGSDYTTLRNHEGHEIRVSHHAISHKYKSQLDALPLHAPKKMAQGGKVEEPVANYAAGTPEDTVSQEDAPPAQPTPGASPAIQAGGAQPITINVGAQPAAPAPQAPAPAPQQPQVQAAPPPAAPMAPPAQESAPPTMADKAMQDTPETAPAGTFQGALPVPPTPAQNAANIAANPGPEATTGLNPNNPGTPPSPEQQVNLADEGTSGQQAPAPERAPSSRPAGLHPNIANPHATPEEARADTTAILSKEDQAWQHDLANGHISPETYESLFAKKDTIGKIGSIFGLMMGALGSGIGGGPNLYLEQMNKLIDRDMEAQKNSKANAFNMLRLNQDKVFQKAQISKMEKDGVLSMAQARNLNAEADTRSDTLSRMKLNRAAAQSMSEQIERMPEGAEKEKAKQQLGMLFGAINNENYSLAARAGAASALLSAGNGAPGSEESFQTQMNAWERSGDPERMKNAAQMRARHLPGFTGAASEDLAPKTKDELKKMATFDSELARFHDWTSKHSGVLPTTPANTAIINQGRVMARDLQNSYREAQLNTVYRPSEAPLLNQVIPEDPTKFLNKWRVLPQIQALRSMNLAKLKTAAKSEGLGDYVGYKGTAGVGAEQDQIKTDANGVKWRRGPNGKAVRVN